MLKWHRIRISISGMFSTTLKCIEVLCSVLNLIETDLMPGELLYYSNARVILVGPMDRI